MSAEDKSGKGTGRSGRSDNLQLQEEGFLRRWSRRKGARNDSRKKVKEALGPSGAFAYGQAVREDLPEMTHEDVNRDALVVDQSVEGEDRPQEVIDPTETDDAELPDIESLTAESDFTPYLKKGVSEQLQRRALRKLWLSDPVLANVDGLVDYGGDFTNAATVIENLKSVYTVGRGMVPEPEVEVEEEALDGGDTQVKLDAPGPDDMTQQEVATHSGESPDLPQDKDEAATAGSKELDDGPVGREKG